MPFTSSSDPFDAAQALAEGRLAVIPTETVYGLGARADNTEAVARVFATKDRPVDHPLIAHVQNAEAVNAWVSHIPDYAEALMREFWPGPMTLVLPRSERAADFITGGQDTVAVRVPGSPVAREVLRALADIVNDPSVAVAAPSANRFGRVSPTTAQHAAEEVGQLLHEGDVILDAGPCLVGLESTIIDCTKAAPVVLRPGKISAEQIRHVTGRELGERTLTRAPGTLASHYAPRARVQLLDSEALADLPAEASIGIIALSDVNTPAGLVRLTAPNNDDDYAASLYRALREADSLGLELVVAVPPKGSGLADAIRDRLQRAAHD